MTHVLPLRSSPRPRTHKGLPHQQLDQQPRDDTIRVRLAERLVALQGVAEAPSGISVPGARALVLRDATTGPPAAFMGGREFAHLHPPPDQSLHLTLPEQRAREVIQAGWAEFHPLVEEGRLPPTVVMVYAPRDEAELKVVSGLVQESYQFASGRQPQAAAERPETAAACARRREPMHE
jgi:phospholipase/carboxylesterase